MVSDGSIVAWYRGQMGMTISFRSGRRFLPDDKAVGPPRREMVTLFTRCNRQNFGSPFKYTGGHLARHQLMKGNAVDQG